MYLPKWYSLGHPAAKNQHSDIEKFNPLKCPARAIAKCCYLPITTGDTFTTEMNSQRSITACP